MLINYNKDNDSVLFFLRFLYDKYQNGFDLQNLELHKGYDLYVDFCNNNLIDFVSRNAYARLLARIGIVSEIKWSPGDKKMTRIKQFDPKNVGEILQRWSKVEDYSVQRGVWEVGNDRFEYTLRVKRLNDLFREHSEEVEVKKDEYGE